MKVKHGLFDYFKLLRKFNTLTIKYESLVEATKNDCFKELLHKIENYQNVEKLKKENKELRLKIRALKEIVKEGQYGRNKSKKIRNKSTIRNKS